MMLSIFIVSAERYDPEADDEDQDPRVSPFIMLENLSTSVQAFQRIMQCYRIFNFSSILINYYSILLNDNWILFII